MKTQQKRLDEVRDFLLENTVGDYVVKGTELNIQESNDILIGSVLPKLISYKKGEFEIKSDSMLSSPNIAKKTNRLMKRAVKVSMADTHLFGMVKNEGTRYQL